MRVTGVVKWFSCNRGYGFIETPIHSQDVFVHYSAIRGEGFRSLRDGQQVEFEFRLGDRGALAADVALLPAVHVPAPAPELSVEGFALAAAS